MRKRTLTHTRADTENIRGLARSMITGIGGGTKEEVPREASDLAMESEEKIGAIVIGTIKIIGETIGAGISDIDLFIFTFSKTFI